jgi:hypothetical protein
MHKNFSPRWHYERQPRAKSEEKAVEAASTLWAIVQFYAI